MTGRLGGKRRPTLPAAVRRPELNDRDSFPSVRTNRSRLPTTRMVTPEAPVKVVRKAQMTTLMMASPPGSQPSRLRNSLTSRSPALLSEMM